MLIDCPTCARSYHVSHAEIGEKGRTVICPQCHTHWFVQGANVASLAPAADDLRTASFSSRPRVLPSESASSTARARVSPWRMLRTPLAGAVCLALATGAIGARQRIVKAVPRLAGIYQAIGLPVNVRGLEISNLSTERPDAGSLILTGAIRNVARHRVLVPRLVYEVRDRAGATLATWTERGPAAALGPGRSLPFASAPHDVPLDGYSIFVRFEPANAPAPLNLAGR